MFTVAETDAECVLRTRKVLNTNTEGTSTTPNTFQVNDREDDVRINMDRDEERITKEQDVEDLKSQHYEYLRQIWVDKEAVSKIVKEKSVKSTDTDEEPC